MATKDLKDVRIIFVLGGPGAGKGTLCAKLSEKYGYAHYSAGDLLRAAAAAPDEQGARLSKMLKNGEIVPSEVTIGLLKNAILSSTTNTFLIDGFPRNIDQGETFEQVITPCKFVLFLDAPQDIMKERILNRAQETLAAGGVVRSDDNEDSLAKRFKTHYDTCLPVVGHYEKQSKVVTIDARLDAAEVLIEVERALTNYQ